MTAVVLAAGASTRFGAHKLLMPLGGMPIVAVSVAGALISAVDDVVVVLGRNEVRMRWALAEFRVGFASNPEYATGMSSSLRVAVRAVPPASDALLVLLADQPELPACAIDQVVAAFRRTGAPVVRPVYGGAPGHPVLFARSLFPDLARAEGDEDPHGVVACHSAGLVEVPMPGPLPHDVDTPADYRASLRRWADARRAPEPRDAWLTAASARAGQP